MNDHRAKTLILGIFAGVLLSCAALIAYEIHTSQPTDEGSYIFTCSQPVSGDTPIADCVKRI